VSASDRLPEFEGSLDFTIELLADGEFQVWTPEMNGACIGVGATFNDAIDDAIRALTGTIPKLAEMKKA
jgi:hypothetical protein